jgi:hypothetical protein
MWDREKAFVQENERCKLGSKLLKLRQLRAILDKRFLFTHIEVTRIAAGAKLQSDSSRRSCGARPASLEGVTGLAAAGPACSALLLLGLTFFWRRRMPLAVLACWAVISRPNCSLTWRAISMGELGSVYYFSVAPAGGAG